MAPSAGPQVEHVELLATQRRLYELPRGMGRFREYLRVILDGRGDVRLPPLGLMNPMAHEHVAARLDEWLALGAEATAAKAVAEASRRLEGAEGRWQHGLVIADDVRSGWTNRYTTEAEACFGQPRFAGLRRGWITTILWASQPPSLADLRAEILRTIYREMYRQRHGQAHTLRERLDQEGQAAHFGGLQPRLQPEELEYSWLILQPLLDSDESHVCFAALFGDQAARALGYEPLGLPERAGFEVALAEADRAAPSDR